VVQSTDKNFLVPVGGAVVFSARSEFVATLSRCYPGRASMSPVLDLFITLLSLGERGYRRLLDERMRLLPLLSAGLGVVAAKFQLKVLSTPGNTISMGVCVDRLRLAAAGKSVTYLGSMLFLRSVSGCRVVECSGASSTVAGYSFVNWGSHCDRYPHDYFTVACSIGLAEEEVLVFLERLNKAIHKFSKDKTVSA